MKKTTEPGTTDHIKLFSTVVHVMRSDLARALQPLSALWTGWREGGVVGACRLFLRAQRRSCPQGVFSLLLLMQGLMLIALLTAIVIAGVLTWEGVVQ